MQDFTILHFLTVFANFFNVFNKARISGAFCLSGSRVLFYI